MYKKLWSLIILVLVAGCGCPLREQVGERYEQEVPPVRRREAVPAEVTPQGQIAFISPGRNLHIINADGTGEKIVAVNEEFHSHSVWSPDGESIAFTHANYNVAVLDIDDLKITQITDLTLMRGETVTPVQWLPDGQRLLLRKQEGLWLTNRDGTDLVQIVPSGEHPWGTCPYSPRISPDGSKIAYFVWLGKDYPRLNWALATINIDGTDQVVLSKPYSKTGLGLTWSPCGEKIAYDMSYKAQVINRDGTNRIFIGREATSTSWTPDGRIVFAGSRNFYIVNVDGTGKRVFKPQTQKGLVAGFPSWSPCGRWFVFGSDRSIHIYEADGRRLKKLVFGWDPRWSPATP